MHRHLWLAVLWNCDKGQHGGNSYYSEDEPDEAEGDEQESSFTV